MFIGIVIQVVLALIGIPTAYIIKNLTYFQHDISRVKRAGFVEKQVMLGATLINYAEGPNKGPALLLIHGQICNWENYARVLPALSRHYHIYAVDCHGHGKSSKNPASYNVEAMGSDFAKFITEVIHQPAIVSGHSSGGLITAWLAAHSPENVIAVVLEDPPLFSSEVSRMEKTFNYVDLSTVCHKFLQQTEDPDFTHYQLKHCIWMKFFKDGEQPVRNYALSYREKHPHEPVKIFFFPPAINELFRAIDDYDPRFGEAFYTGDWHQNFDHAEALSRITCPSFLIHTSWSYDKDGILLAAMDDKDAQQAHSLLKNNRLIEVKSGHGFHFEKPRQFINIMNQLNDHLTVPADNNPHPVFQTQS